MSFELAAAGLNFLGNMFDGYLTRQWNEEQIDKQWARNLSMWHMENRYNHPAAQVERMKQAGLNPALAYMNGGSFVPAAASPEAGASRANQYGVAPQLDPLMMAQVDLMKAQAEDARASAEQKEQKLPLEKEGLSRQNEKLFMEIEDFRRKWELMEVEKQYKEAMRLNIRFEQVMRGKEYMLQKREVEQKIENMKSEKELTDRQVERAKYDLDYLVKTEALRVMGLNLNNAKMRAEIGLTRNEMNNAFKTGQLLGYQVNSGWVSDQYEQMRIGEVKDWLESKNKENGLPFSYGLQEMIFHSVGRVLKDIPIK